MDYQAVHLLWEGWQVQRNLDDAAALQVAMIYLAHTIDMQPAGLPITMTITEPGHSWGTGVSVIMPLLDSHMAAHTLIEKRHVYFDLFSCKPFAVSDVTVALFRIFKPGMWRHEVRDRTVKGD